jgi:RND family efflux transporter MFP subunit
MTPKPKAPQAKDLPPAPQPWWALQRVRRILWATAASLVAVGLAWFYAFHPFVSTDDARIAATLVRIAAEGSGGRILDIKAKEGDAVRQGDVLVELDHRIAQAELERAQSKADVTLRELKRAQQLAAQRGLSAKELDTSRSAAQVAQAELALAQVALDNTYLKSPVDGVVVQTSSEVGNMMERGQTALTIADVEHAWIAANIEETSVGRLKLGQRVRISVDEGGELRGQVFEIGSAAASQFALIPADNAAGNFTKLVQRIPIKISIDPHPGQDLRAGESVEIRIRVL